MEFHEILQQANVTPKEIIQKLGCPRGTAYDWYEGRRSPPLWQWSTWLHQVMAASLADFYVAKVKKRLEGR